MRRSLSGGTANTCGGHGLPRLCHERTAHRLRTEVEVTVHPVRDHVGLMCAAGARHSVMLPDAALLLRDERNGRRCRPTRALVLAFSMRWLAAVPRSRCVFVSCVSAAARVSLDALECVCSAPAESRVPC